MDKIGSIASSRLRSEDRAGVRRDITGEQKQKQNKSEGVGAGVQ